MKITSKNLKQIIKEELKTVLGENKYVDKIASLFAQQVDSWNREGDDEGLEDNINHLMFMAKSMDMDFNSLVSILSNNEAAQRAIFKIETKKMPELASRIPIIGVVLVNVGGYRLVVDYDNWTKKIHGRVAPQVAEAIFAQYKEGNIPEIYQNEVLWPLRQVENLPQEFRKKVDALYQDELMKSPSMEGVTKGDVNQIVREEMQELSNISLKEKKTMKLTLEQLKKMAIEELNSLMSEAGLHSREQTAADMEMASKIPEEMVAAAASVLDDNWIQAFKLNMQGLDGMDDLMPKLYQMAYKKWEDE